MTESLEFDIAIIGGGMVGTSLASLLAASHADWRIALIESQPFAQLDETHFQPSFDTRSTALSYGSAEILRELGLWEKLQTHITPIHQVHVSDRGHFLGGLIDASENKVDAVGYVVENAWLGNALLTHVQTQKNIQCFTSANVAQLTPLQNAARLTINTATETFTIKASLAVIADGGDSQLRAALGIGTQVRTYGQTAIITNVEFSEPHHGVAYERFTTDGPVALLPLGESENATQSALIWTLPNDQADEIFALNDDEFLVQLQAHFGFRVGYFTRVAKRYAYPLQLILADEQVRSNVVLVGNAAHFLHPVAGQGFNLALRDCASLVEVLRNAVEEKKSLGDLTVLQTYVDHQFPDQQLTVEFSDKLVRLFSNNNLPLIALRHLGFSALESLPFFKMQFTAQTMGTGGRQFRWKVESEVAPTHNVTMNSIADENIETHHHRDDKNTLVFDVIIVGAGLVGASLACAVAQLQHNSNVNIAVIEAGGAPALYKGEDFDPRVVALTPASQQLLIDIGCWDAIVRQRVCAYHHMTVWDGEGTAQIDFDCAEVREPQLGHIVENSVIVQALRGRMAQHSNIHFFQPAAVVNIKQPEPAQPFVRVMLNTGVELTASLLIAADGAQSRVRELANFATREWDYGQQGIVTTVRTEQSHAYTAWQRFMHRGPLAFLPLQHQGDAHWCSIVWSAEHELANDLMALTDEQFCARVSAAFEYRLGAVTHCAERFAIPLWQRHARTYIQPGIVLVGDAAHNIHPLAGQGVNLGLLDVSALAYEIERALVRGIPLADYSLLRRYQRERLASNLGMMSAMEAFKHLFGNRSLTVNWLRNTGMRQLNSLTAVKKMIIKAALGAR